MSLAKTLDQLIKTQIALASELRIKPVGRAKPQNKPPPTYDLVVLGGRKP